MACLNVESISLLKVAIKCSRSCLGEERINLPKDNSARDLRFSSPVGDDGGPGGREIDGGDEW